MNILCLKFKCHACPEQEKCFGCEHKYILIKQETTTEVYKCSKCGKKIRRAKNET